MKWLKRILGRLRGRAPGRDAQDEAALDEAALARDRNLSPPTPPGYFGGF